MATERTVHVDKPGAQPVYGEIKVGYHIPANLTIKYGRAYQDGSWWPVSAIAHSSVYDGNHEHIGSMTQEWDVDGIDVVPDWLNAFVVRYAPTD